MITPSFPILASDINPESYVWEMVYQATDDVGTYELYRGVGKGYELLTVYVRLWQALKGFPHGDMHRSAYFGEPFFMNDREWFAHHDKIYGVDTESVINPMLFA